MPGRGKKIKNNYDCGSNYAWCMKSIHGLKSDYQLCLNLIFIQDQGGVELETIGKQVWEHKAPTQVAAKDMGIFSQL